MAEFTLGSGGAARLGAKDDRHGRMATRREGCQPDLHAPRALSVLCRPPGPSRDPRRAGLVVVAAGETSAILPG